MICLCTHGYFDLLGPCGQAALLSVVAAAVAAADLDVARSHLEIQNKRFGNRHNNVFGNARVDEIQEFRGKGAL